MKYQPMPGFILVKPELEEEKKSDIILLQGKKKVTNRGIVVAISGPTVYQNKKVECPVKVGDMVTFRAFSQLEVQHNDEPHYIIYFLDLLATYEQRK